MVVITFLMISSILKVEKRKSDGHKCNSEMFQMNANSVLSISDLKSTRFSNAVMINKMYFIGIHLNRKTESRVFSSCTWSSIEYIQVHVQWI